MTRLARLALIVIYVCGAIVLSGRMIHYLLNSPPIPAGVVKPDMKADVMKDDAASLHRPDLSNQKLRVMLLALIASVVLFVLIKPYLGPDWQRPGTVLMQSIAIGGALLLLVPFLFSIGKRGGYSAVPNKLFILHVAASICGSFLVACHAVASFDGPPLMMLAALVLLMITGAFGRVYANRVFAASFAMKPTPFGAHDDSTKAALKNLIEAKVAVLKRLDPAAKEAVFSVTLGHWLRRPVLSMAYARLAHRESMLVKTRQSLPRSGAYWRPLHLLLAWLFLAGMIIHIIVVTFFAGYAADGGEIYWWHITAW